MNGNQEKICFCGMQRTDGVFKNFKNSNEPLKNANEKHKKKSIIKIYFCIFPNLIEVTCMLQKISCSR